MSTKLAMGPNDPSALPAREAYRPYPGNSRLVRRPAGLVGRDRDGQCGPHGASDGCRLRLYRLTLYRHNRGAGSEAYKQGIVDGSAGDIVNSSLFTGIAGNYLRRSIVAAGLDPDKLEAAGPDAMNVESSSGAKAWRDIWGSGQGIGAIDQVQPTADYLARLAREYDAARARLA